MKFHNFVVFAYVNGKRVRRNYKTYFGAMRFLASVSSGDLYYYDLSCCEYRHMHTVHGGEIH